MTPLDANVGGLNSRLHAQKFRGHRNRCATICFVDLSVWAPAGGAKEISSEFNERAANDSFFS
jgi:hypothetical protein